MDTTLLNYLGKNSYPAILSVISEKLMSAEADTIAGTEILKNAFVKLQESVTPVMDLKEFTTNAETLAPHDAKLGEIVDFVRKNVKSGDLNFLINLCKEQHISNQTRAGFPAPQQTIKIIESEFNEPASIIEAGIKKGIFDALDSNLLMSLKTDLGASKNPIDKEAAKGNVDLQLFENFAIYHPVGIRYEKDDSIVMLTENCVLEKIGDAFSQIAGDAVDAVQNISIPYRRLMQSISSLPYDPNNETFSLNNEWDFDLTIQNDGKVVATVGDVNKPIDNADVPKLLLESINKYAAFNSDFDRQSYVNDADNFIILMENHNKLIKMDTYKVIKNLDSNDFVILNESAKNAVIVAASKSVNQPKNHTELLESVSNIVNGKINDFKPLFESQIAIEQNQAFERQETLNNLFEQQKELNIGIKKTRQLKNIAEADSPAFEQLFETETKLEAKLKLVNEQLIALQ